MMLWVHNQVYFNSVAAWEALLIGSIGSLLACLAMPLFDKVLTWKIIMFAVVSVQL